MKRKLIAIVYVLCLMMIFTACSSNQKPSSSETEVDKETDETASSPENDSELEDESESEAETEAETETAEPVNNEELGETLEDPLKVSLDGVVYMLPGSTFADFEANGWAVDPGAEGSTLAANYTTSIDYTKGESVIKLSAANEGDSAVSIQECELWALVYQGSRNGTIEFAFPGGIKNGSTPEEVEAAYGEPTDFYDNSDGVRSSMEYKLDNVKVKFQFLGEDGGLSDFDIRS